MALVDTLSTLINSYSNTDQAWVTFITDHIPYIQTNSMVVIIRDSDRSKYLNRLDRYLLDNGCDQSILWIAKLINGTNLYQDFTTKNSILVPPLAYINTMYRLYRTTVNLA